MTRVYIAGPMSSIGPPSWNYPAFNEAAARLAWVPGLEPVDPTLNELPQGTDTPWDVCLRHALTLLLTCDAVAVLDGWELSKGARLEVEVAHTLNMAVRTVDQWANRTGRYAGTVDATVL